MPATTRSRMRWMPIALLLGILAIAALGACEKKGTAADEGYMYVYDYEGKFIPVEQLHEADPDACETLHLHSAGEVRTLRNEVLSEPHPECGFGQLTLREVPMPDDYNGIQRTDPNWVFQPDE